jgi:hypothetical protein
MLAVAALVQQAATEDPGRHPALVEAREAGADPAAGADLPRPPRATADGGQDAPSTTAPVPLDVDAPPLAPAVLPTEVSGIGAPTEVVDADLHPPGPLVAPMPPDIEAPPAPIATEQPIEQDAPVPRSVHPPDVDEPAL